DPTAPCVLLSRTMQSNPSPDMLGSASTSAVSPTPMRIARGWSDRTIAWWFIAPSVVLLLAINIFPLIWTIHLSFTNFHANMPNAPVRFLGLGNYIDVLTDEDVWAAMQVTARFVVCSITLEVLLGFGLALLINRRFRGHSFWTTLILWPMMLSPAVVGNFWTFILQPQTGLFNDTVGFITG